MAATPKPPQAATELRGDLPVLPFASAKAWEAWLVAQPHGSAGLWLKLAKKDAGVPSVTKAQALEVALCHGWIDGQLQPYDQRFWLVRFSPRRPRSIWSQINRSTATRLMAEGRMSAAGLAQVQAAQADGRWDAAYPPQSQATVPEDLQAALAANPSAQAFFATLTGANRYAVLHRIHDAKTAKTRQQRIDKFVAMLARHEVLHPKPAKD